MVLHRPNLITISKLEVTHRVQRHLSGSLPRTIYQVKQLQDWNLKEFQEHAFRVRIPAKLPFNKASLPPACYEWFVHDGKYAANLDQPPVTSELRTSFWSEHDTTMVPLELSATTSIEPETSSSESDGSHFLRTTAPLKILLEYLTHPSALSDPSMSERHSIYLAQCDLTSLPERLRQDLPTPSLVTSAGKGDIYSSSLWLGRPPTYTPLHRDPNPNLFLQLAGQKIVRLLPPELGDIVFENVQQQLVSSSRRVGPRSTAASPSFRGEEMMAGPEKALLHDLIWHRDNENSDNDSDVTAYMQEARLRLGEALFIPKGWWHSVKGVGDNDSVTASANWWFR